MKQKNHGFTLVELMLVIAIIGILATVLFALLGPQRERARLSNFKQTLGTLRAAFTTCHDVGGNLLNSESDTSVVADGNSDSCSVPGYGKLVEIPQCNGAKDEYVTINGKNTSTDNWYFTTSCARGGGGDQCHAYCNSNGCVFCDTEMAATADGSLPSCAGTDYNCK